jgi:hypothetical protein
VIIPNDFRDLSKIADKYSGLSSSIDLEDAGIKVDHRLARHLHRAARDLGKYYGMPTEIINHHQSMADFHQKQSGGYGTPTEGPHAPLKGGFLGQPVINTPGK